MARTDTDAPDYHNISNTCPNVNVNTDVGGIHLELDPECSWTWEARERANATKAMTAETILTRDLVGPPWPAQKQNTSGIPKGQDAAYSNCA